MNEIYGQAFLILIVGMITVFSILLLIVVAGKGLIQISNYFFEKGENSSNVKETDLIPKKEIAAITAAVSHITGGLGKIERISKIRQ